MRNVAFLPQAFADFTQWATEDRQIYAKIIDLIKDIQRQPFAGLGKPEPLYRRPSLAVDDGVALHRPDTTAGNLKAIVF